MLAETAAKTALIAGSQFALAWLPARVHRAVLTFGDEREPMPVQG